jgi:molybdate transport system substrate-binding protein
MLKKTLAVLILGMSLGVLPVSAGGTAEAAESLGEYKVRVAAASSLRELMPKLLEEYGRFSDDAEIEVIFGSSGKLYAQILSGAPFDIFLAANERYPSLLAEAGMADDSPRRYFTGTLVCVSMLEDFPDAGDFASLTEWLRRTKGKIAIANPHTAPYGEAYERLSKGWPEIFPGIDTPRIVTAGSVSQAFHFAFSGADCAFVSRSLLGEDADPSVKSVIIEEKYSGPILQYGVLLNRGGNDSVARRFWDFLLGPWGQKILAGGEGAPE